MMQKANHTSKLQLLLATSLLCLLFTTTGFAARIIYVDDDAAGASDGSSWNSAYTFLQDALADANSAEKPVEIRVAQGIYKPDQGAGITPGDYRNRFVSFQLINEVTIKGGFAGLDEPDPNAWDIGLFQTILSGDLNGDDIDVNDPCDLLDEPSRFDNSRNVVTGSNTDATAVLDGFTITGGYISVIPFGGSPAGGAGMLISSGSPTLIDCKFTDNVTGNTGGGLLIYDDSNPTLLNCKFTRNYAESGGGIFSCRSSSPTLINCILNNNYAQHKGGGMYIADGNPKLTNCTFSHNSVFGLYSGGGTAGGGMYNINSSPVLTNCTFSENSSAFAGGGMFNKDCNTVLNMCEFVRNTASSYSGAVSNSGQLIAKGCVFKKNYPGAVEDGPLGPIFTDCTFSGNSSPNSGGAVRIFEATFSHCIFAGNRALGDNNTGGAVYSFVTATFDNCTFSNNWADSRRAIDNGGTAYVNNCIFWGSEDQIRADNPRQFPFVDYSDIQGGWTWPGEGNIDADPCFADPGYWADADDPNVFAEPNDPNAVWIGGDYHLKSQAGRYDPNSGSWVQDDVTSPCIDAGDPNSSIGHEPFPNGGIVNMGAYGGTVKASKSYFGEAPCGVIIAGDINGDCKVDYKDFVLLATHWLEDNTP